MKKTGILNSQLSGLIAALGHKDQVMIGDAGMPIPQGVTIVDLAVCAGVPTFAQVLNAVLGEMCVEHFDAAEETAGNNPEIWALLQKSLPDVPYDTMSHEKLKEKSAGVKFAIRTGECTPFANVILRSGVVF
ncbi:D-ribose pyranase [Zongyangia hominis]|uniref:D-ribose pyranase n=1 Tax=Zongyangia hominis TaxID=2763677 RepID=A0A926EEI9_9FIRM|nr:D-ribose pyranase [Zongyangia hominis]MBC8570431.1 D-ribose pyranase [Zongyangia hominis]